MARKIEFSGIVRGVEFRGTAEFHDGEPGEGPKLVKIIWSVDPGLSDDDDEGWLHIAHLAWNVYDDPRAWPPSEGPAPANVVW